MPRVAIAQTCPVSAPSGLPTWKSTSEPFPTLTANLRQVEQVLADLASQKPDIVIFPEYFLQGILNEKRQYNSLPSKHLDDALTRLAGRYGVAIVGTIVHGTASHMQDVPDVSPLEGTEGQRAWSEYLQRHRDDLDDTEGFTLYNEAFYIDKEGVRGRYHKLNLWHPEREYLAQGKKKFPVFDTPWGKAGFLICWDLSHPAEAQGLANQGADIIFAPMYWLGTDSDPVASQHNPDKDYELKVVQALAYARAFETECALIACNAGGDRDKDGFMGGSGVWAPLLGKFAGFEGEEVGVRVVDVDLGILKTTYKYHKLSKLTARHRGICIKLDQTPIGDVDDMCMY